MTAVPLKHLVRINARTLGEDTDPDRVIRYIDIGAVGTGMLVDQPATMTFRAAPSRARRLVEAGDTIVSTVRTYLRAVWPVRGDTQSLVVSTGFAVLTPGPELDPGYLGWIAQSTPFVDAIVARSVGVSYPAVNASDIGNLRVDVPPLNAQRLIADYLDKETTRIYELLDKKRRLRALIMQRQAAHVEQEIRGLAAEWGEVALKYLAERITVGIVITPAAWYVNDGAGVTALRGTNVEPNQLRLDDLAQISQAGHALHAKSALRAGDVVVVRTGQAGAAVVVPPELEGANCIDLILVRPGMLDADFLQFVLNSDWAQKHIAEHSVGTIQSHFNIGAMKVLPIPAAPRTAQVEAVARLRGLTSHTDELRIRLDKQVARLVEHRQALITAAVTGELEIPGAA